LNLAGNALPADLRATKPCQIALLFLLPQHRRRSG
jgi:hypothetical protein